MGDSSSSSESEPDTPPVAPQTTTEASPTPASGDQEGNQRKKAPRRTHSVAHEDFGAKNIVLFNVDLETGGNLCGPVQISVAAFDPHNKISLVEFDSYVKPAFGAKWNQFTINVHGIEPSQQRIKDARQIEAVWHDLLEYFHRLLEGGKKGIILAWGGKACDVEWMFRITEETHLGILKMPDNVPYFCDPRHVINHYKGCKLRTEGMLGLGCAEMWCHITNNDKLDGAHSSIVDARAQQEIVSDDRFMQFLDKPESIVSMDSVWEAKRKKRILQDAELKRPLPKGWTEDDTRWEIPYRISYENAQGGAPHGPSTKAKTVCENGSLAELFFLFFPLSLVDKVAQQTQQYGVEDWVRPVEPSDSQLDENSSGDESDESYSTEYIDDSGGTDSDDNIDDYVNTTSSDDDTSYVDPRVDSSSSTSSKANSDSSTGPGLIKDRLRKAKRRRARKLFGCKKEHRNARHRSIGNWIPVTAGFIIVWLGAAIILGATKLRSADMMFSTHYNTNIPYVQNALGRDAFRQIRQFIHFADNNAQPKKGAAGWSPLQKVAPVLDVILVTLAAAWILGKRITIDESMIKYTGRAISFIQYMPAKPIKHGIKVFALCCAVTGFLYHFEIYTGKEGCLDGSPGEVVKRLLSGSKIGTSKGRILYTDNFYTSLGLMTYLYIAYSMLMVGTYRLTKKKSRTADDFPFHKISNSAISKVPRGWKRQATQQIMKDRRHLFTVQASTSWKDRKQVGFLHNNLVQPTQNYFVQRHVKNGKKQKISSHEIVSDYSKYMGGVDHKDRDTAD
jgi:hypothetical protein